MKRFFISPHPTFGSYKNPIKFKIDESPYFWWWYALTLNNKYKLFCEENNNFKNNYSNKEEIQIKKLYEDFGDVRYAGCRYVAFTKWWTNRVNTNETRGVYLFAEPQDNLKVEIVNDKEEFKTEIDKNIVVSIPLSLSRKYIDKDITRILKNRAKTEKGRKARNPKSSRARYSLSKACVPTVLKKTFDLYDAKQEAINKQNKVSNVQLGIIINLVYNEKNNQTELRNEENKRRKITIVVSRYLKNAKNMIGNTTKGYFP